MQWRTIEFHALLHFCADSFDADLLTSHLIFFKLTFGIIATVILAVRKMHFVKLGSPKNATDAFAMRDIRAVIATKVISMETKLEQYKAWIS